MATQNNIISDLSTLTHIPNKALTELIDKEMLCISSAIHDAKTAGETVLQLNIGLGTLSIELESMQCKFIPSHSLKTYIKHGLANAIDPIMFDTEQAIIDKLMELCEDTI